MGSFGFGRRLVFLNIQLLVALLKSMPHDIFRICAGRNLGDATVWLGIASLLSVYNISQAVDEQGHKIDVSEAMKPVGSFLWCVTILQMF